MRALLIVLFLYSATILAEESFVIQDIEVVGLKGITAGTVFSYLPVNIGDTFSLESSPEIIRVLYKTGFFHDIRLARRDNVLIVKLKERPIITEINVEGAKKIKKEELKSNLRDIGLVKGNIYNPVLLEGLEIELQKVYYTLGRYAVEVESQVTELEDNKVKIDITIYEGNLAKIKQINILGNESFSDKKLLKLFDLNKPRFLGMFRKKQYAKPILTADIEKLKSFYLDKGYLKFNILSQQVSITPDKRSIYIDISLFEGEVYTLNNIELTGDFVVPKEELEKLITIQKGDTFSQKNITQDRQALSKRLGNDGYAFANINILTKPLDDNLVDIKFVIDSGQRMYVRRIEFIGNYQTEDETLRRELRQLEGAWYSNEKIERSKIRLQRLSFIGGTQIETKPVAGSSDQLDLTFKVDERLAGNLLIGAGYSQSQGILLNVAINQNNFLGTGKKLGLNLTRSGSRESYSISYIDPYHTIDGVSRGFNIFYRSIDADKEDIDNYLADIYGGSVQYGIPLSEFSSFNFSLEYQHTKITAGTDTAQNTSDFLNEYGDNFNTLTIGAAWSYDTRDRVVFPRKGRLQKLSGDFVIPGSDLQYYKLGYLHKNYYQLSNTFTLLLRTELGYGYGYGNTDELPFFEHYYAGGINTVRGYDDYSLGPRDVKTDDPIGGSLKVLGGAEILFPATFLADEKNLRFSAFLDIGNVFDGYTHFDAGDLRLSTGLGMVWFTPVGILKFSVAYPLNEQKEDKTQTFQFAIGTTF